jgi:hypothetical protein
MSTPTTKSEYLVICRGVSWDETKGRGEVYARKSLSPEDIQNAVKQFYAWFERLSDEGKMKGGHQLAPEGKILSGRKAVTDLALPESKEAIAGYWFIYADSLEEAVEIAKGNPGLEYGQTIEVRPILPEAATSIGQH